jgi:hypothetical protein
MKGDKKEHKEERKKERKKERILTSTATASIHTRAPPI